MREVGGTCQILSFLSILSTYFLLQHPPPNFFRFLLLVLPFHCLSKIWIVQIKKFKRFILKEDAGGCMAYVVPEELVV